MPRGNLILQQLCNQLVLLHDALACELIRHHLDTAATDIDTAAAAEGLASC